MQINQKLYHRTTKCPWEMQCKNANGKIMEHTYFETRGGLYTFLFGQFGNKLGYISGQACEMMVGCQLCLYCCSGIWAEDFPSSRQHFCTSGGPYSGCLMPTFSSKNSTWVQVIKIRTTAGAKCNLPQLFLVLQYPPPLKGRAGRSHYW